MIDELRPMAIFAETMRQGSFRAAARTLGLSPSVVSYHITQLEMRVGTALIYRSTRKLSLTSEGKILFKHAVDMLASAEQGFERVSADNNEPAGKLKITVPSVLTRASLGEQISTFSKLYPNIELQISYTDVRQDIISEGIDMAIRAGELEDSSLKTKRIGKIERKLVCSSEYWALQEKPTCPPDLELWNWIKLEMLPNHRTLVRTDHPPARINFNSNICVNNVDAMTVLCIYGLGLATPPSFLVDEYVTSGKLIEVLPAWRVEPVPLYAIWPGNVSDNSNAKRLLNHLINSGPIQ